MSLFLPTAGHASSGAAFLAKHYLPSKTVCACDPFPAYSSQQHCDAKLPPKFDNLCLFCVYTLCNSLGAPASIALYRGLHAVDTDICTVYAPLHSDSEIRRHLRSLVQEG